MITSGVFYYLFQTIHPSEILQVFRDIDSAYLLGFLLLSLSGSYFRARRYQLTLIPTGHPPELLPLFLITLVRNFTSDLLPARLGTTAYIYLVRTHAGMSYATATASFALSFLFDLLVLAPLLLLITTMEYHSLAETGTGVLILGTVVSLICFVLLLTLDRALILISKVFALLRIVPDSLLEFGRKVSDEVRLARACGIYYRLFFLSLLVRLCKYGSLYLFLVGILVPLGYSPLEIPVFKSILGILSAETAASLPISGIAGFGAYEGAWTFAFHLMGFPLELSKLTAISHHLFTQFYGYSLGALALLILALPYRKILFFLTTPFRTLLTVFVLLTLIALFHLFGDAASPAVKERPNSVILSSENITSFSDKIIFDSRRGATFGIYSVQSGKIRKVIDAKKWHEIYPDVSSDGTLLVYSRSRSLSRHAPAEIWLLNLLTGEKNKIVSEGTFPTFGSSNDSIYYELNRSKVMLYSLSTGQNTEIFPSTNTTFHGAQIVKPRVSPNGRFLSFTSDTPTPWHAWRVDLSTDGATKIARGCEPAWYPDLKSAWIKKEGLKAGSGIMVYNPMSKKSSILLDNGPPLGHEYFPTISQDGRYLLYSAAPYNEHDHLSASYQLFIYDFQSGENKQLTSDKYTNRWPKLAPFIEK